MANKSGIHIKPSREGSLRKATHTKEGQKISMATLQAEKNSDNPAMRKKANFAINARGWNHSHKIGKKLEGRLNARDK